FQRSTTPRAKASSLATSLGPQKVSLTKSKSGFMLQGCKSMLRRFTLHVWAGVLWFASMRAFFAGRDGLRKHGFGRTVAAGLRVIRCSSLTAVFTSNSVEFQFEQRTATSRDLRSSAILHPQPHPHSHVCGIAPDLLGWPVLLWARVSVRPEAGSCASPSRPTN